MPRIVVSSAGGRFFRLFYAYNRQRLCASTTLPIRNGTFTRSCSCTTPRPAHAPGKPSSRLSSKSDAPDHRDIGTSADLFITSPYSPGSPLFQPNGAQLFNKLVDFLRAQYPVFGFREVITPNVYKKGLWEKSGHWEMYAEDMFQVSGRSSKAAAIHSAKDTTTTAPLQTHTHGSPEETDTMGLKPMNCPGHCLMFGSRKRSYRDLPIRFADFSALHRNENSGSLSGLTRVRRFHQDDGHIFCRPSQIGAEISKTLAFVKMAYVDVFKLGTYRLVLSTRPKDGEFVGSKEEWDAAETQLKDVLTQSGQDFGIAENEGAFYGPKIDIILRDSDGKEHQTATVQLDFQLPRRFELEYMAPDPQSEQRGAPPTHAEESHVGPVTPVLIHRAVLGSVERFIALLLERYNGRYPFWLTPHQVAILAMSGDPALLEYAQKLTAYLSGVVSEWPEHVPGAIEEAPKPRPLGGVHVQVDLDSTSRTLGKKLRQAREDGYNFSIVVGMQEAEKGTVMVNWLAQPEYEGKLEKKDKWELTKEDAREFFQGLIKDYL